MFSYGKAINVKHIQDISKNKLYPSDQDEIIVKLNYSHSGEKS